MQLPLATPLSFFLTPGDGTGNPRRKHSPKHFFPQHFNFISSWVVPGSIPLVVGLWAALPAQALEVKFSPAQPRLGDTITVEIQTDQPGTEAPTVTWGQQTVRAFPQSNNQFRAFVATTPLDRPGRTVLRVSGDGTVKQIPLTLQNRSFPVQRINLPPGKAGVRATELELRRVAEIKKLVSPEKYWQGAFVAPNRGRISTVYGVRRYYNGKFANDYYHRGVDYAGGAGSPVVAPAAGRVVLVGRVSQGFRVHGNVIGLDHGQGVLSIMMHLSQMNVKEGDFVKPGQKIGTVGSTGASTGPHLHWGLYVNGLSVDPTIWRTRSMN